MTREFAELRPPGHMLGVLLRAAVADAGDNGPWLQLVRTEGAPAVVHHGITMTRVPATPTRLPMLSGLDVLGYAQAHMWHPDDVTNPSARQLRALVVHAMLHNDAVLWFRDYPAWSAWQESDEFQRERDRHDDNASAAARGLRWSLAERWLAAK